MTEQDRLLLRDSVMHHEGLRLTPYTDTTGHLTIGYGRNLTDIGISPIEAVEMLKTDLQRAEADCIAVFDWFPALDGIRQAVLVEMCFNLGMSRLRGFGQTLKAVKEGRYDIAADQMLKSKWAQQVGKRARTLAARMRSGVE